MSEGGTQSVEVAQLVDDIKALIEGRNSDAALSALVHVTAATCRHIGVSDQNALVLATEVAGHIRQRLRVMADAATGGAAA